MPRSDFLIEAFFSLAFLDSSFTAITIRLTMKLDSQKIIYAHFFLAMIVALFACAPIPTQTPQSTDTPRPTRTLIPETPTPIPTETLMPTPTATPTPLPTVSISITLKPGPGFDASPGSAELIGRGNQTEVKLEINSRFDGLVKSAQIQEGFCLTSGAIKFPLNNLADGKSTSVLQTSLSSLLIGTLSINLKPAPDANTLIACTGIPRGVILYFDPGRDEHQSGVALLIAQEGRTEVTLQMPASGAGAVRPAQLFDGACPNLGAVKYPLNNIADGKSFTSIPFPLTDLLRNNWLIGVRKSFAEPNVFVACGAIK
ncbi:MAG: hypothetical protein HY070_12950 [Chloroflexi bacterium]|nr:hypothetical protein [Chloroflexota bacterium]